MTLNLKITGTRNSSQSLDNELTSCMPECSLTSFSWKSRFPGLDNPALYVEIKYKGHGAHPRTKSIRGDDRCWDDDLMLYVCVAERSIRKPHHGPCSPGVEEDQILRFCLKVVMPLINDQIVGEAEWKVVRPHGYTPPYRQRS